LPLRCRPGLRHILKDCWEFMNSNVRLTRQMICSRVHRASITKHFLKHLMRFVAILWAFALCDRVCCDDSRVVEILDKAEESISHQLSLGKQDRVCIEIFLTASGPDIEIARRNSGFFVGLKDGWIFASDALAGDYSYSLSTVHFCNSNYRALVSRSGPVEKDTFWTAKNKYPKFELDFVGKTYFEEFRTQCWMSAVLKGLLVNATDPLGARENKDCRGGIRLIENVGEQKLSEVTFLNVAENCKAITFRFNSKNYHLEETEWIGQGPGAGFSRFAKVGKWVDFEGVEIPQDVFVRIRDPKSGESTQITSWEKRTPESIGFRPEHLTLGFYGLSESEVTLIPEKSFSVYYWATGILAIILAAGAVYMRKMR
jgi:hypothetical protein